MAEPQRSAFDKVHGWIAARLSGHRDIGLLGLAVVLGAASAYASILFRIAVEWLESKVVFAFSSDGADPVYWWWPLLTLTGGGLAIGLAVHWLTRDRRPEGVADVIDAYVHSNRRLTLKGGITHASISAASIGFGASVGREGPVVHLGASVANWLGNTLSLGRDSVRIMLGCGVAAAIAASFNAPIAGVFFALEVVIGNYALQAFAPIVIASVVGTMISRAHFGNMPAFVVPDHEIVSVLEFPAFALLGVGAALIAAAFVRVTSAIRDSLAATPLPVWAQPALGGVLVGLIALFAPQVLGVGYGSTDAALQANLTISVLLLLLAAKFAATVICIGTGFGGGVFSPSLFLGAMYGGAFGLVAAQLFPELASSQGVYALVGTTAVAGAVLGAPISTILMVFELTDSYSVTAAMMMATVVGGVLLFEIKGRSWFHAQLFSRGHDISGDRVALLMESMVVSAIMRRNPPTIAADASLETVRERLPFAEGGQLYVIDKDNRLCGLIALNSLTELLQQSQADGEPPLALEVAARDPVALTPETALDEARRRLDVSGATRLPIVKDRESLELVGVLDARDVLRALHRAMCDSVTGRI